MTRSETRISFPPSALTRWGLNLAATLCMTALALVGAAPATAAETRTAEQEEAIDAVNNYLRALSTMSGKFTQIGPRGGITHGEFAIRRPGMMRIDYAPPNPLLIVADGLALYIKDDEKDTTIDPAPLKLTPFYVFLRKDVDLRRSGVIADVQSDEKTIELTTVDPDGDLQGETKLLFTKEPMQLTSWTVINAMNERTRMNLLEIEVGGRLRNDLFERPEAYRRRRRSGFGD